MFTTTKKFLSVFLLCFSIVGLTAEVVELNSNLETKKTLTLMTVQKSNESNFDGRYLRKVQSSMSCGFAPFPPLGCKVGSCVCDSRGQNCHWTFICS
jgi:hypothetical protein